MHSLLSFTTTLMPLGIRWQQNAYGQFFSSSRFSVFSSQVVKKKWLDVAHTYDLRHTHTNTQIWKMSKPTQCHLWVMHLLPANLCMKKNFFQKTDILLHCHFIIFPSVNRRWHQSVSVDFEWDEKEIRKYKWALH